jgi:hypothetical protein
MMRHDIGEILSQQQDATALMRRATPHMSPVEWLRHRSLQSLLFIPVSI